MTPGNDFAMNKDREAQYKVLTNFNGQPYHRGIVMESRTVVHPLNKSFIDVTNGEDPDDKILLECVDHIRSLSRTQ